MGLLYNRARTITPGGANTLSRAGERFPLGAFPELIERGDGAQVLTSDGTWLVDWVGSLGACPLGYGNSTIEYAITQQLRNGAIFSLAHRMELEFSERICKTFGFDMVRWVSSGSEACTGAMRTARAFTGKPVIVISNQSYHGWHDGYAASKEVRPGVPECLTALIRKFTYNDLETLESALRPGDVAAVLMEPTLWEKPHDGFLNEVRNLAHQYGALFVLDEMIMGLRMSLQGGSKYFDVHPDIACYGKSLANGLPVACLIGRRDIMEHSWFMSGTFSGNALSLAAANAVLDVYESKPVIETMWRRGKELQDHISARSNSKIIVCDGYPCKPRIRFTTGDEAVNQKAMSLFLQVSAEHGALFHPGGLNVCYALTDEDMQRTFTAVDLGLIMACTAALTGDWSALKGDIIKPVVTVRQ
jgi:glutamate-1-semialdehyde aminotransferase